MFGIIKKDFLYYLAYFGLTAGAVLLNLGLDGMDPGLVIMMGSFGALSVLGAIGVIEMAEDKTNGYMFLDTLPVTAEAVVGAKFLMALVSLVCFMVFAVGILAGYAPSHEFFVLGRGYVAVCANAALLLVGGVYVGAFKAGFTRFFKSALVTVPILVVVLPILLSRVLRSQLAGMDVAALVRSASVPNLVILTVLCLAVYYGLMRTAIKNY